VLLRTIASAVALSNQIPGILFGNRAPAYSILGWPITGGVTIVCRLAGNARGITSVVTVVYGRVIVGIGILWYGCVDVRVMKILSSVWTFVREVVLYGLPYLWRLYVTCQYC